MKKLINPISGIYLVLSLTLLLTLIGFASSSAQEVIIDNGEAGTSSTGSWSVSGGSDPYGANSLYSKNAGSTYTFEAVVDGSYTVSLWWTERPSRCTDVPMEIYDGNTLLDTVVVNQQKHAGQWNVLGTYVFNGTAGVTITAQGGCSACADAVRFRSDTVYPPRNVRVIESPKPGFKFHFGHYLELYLGRTLSSMNLIKNNPNFVGFHARYTWKELEPQKNKYDFSRIESELNYAKSMGKYLVIELAEIQFSNNSPFVPDYLLTAEYGGGVTPRLHGGWVPKYWNTAVQARFVALYKALGARFGNEPYFEGIMRTETAVGIDTSQVGFTNQGYLNALKNIILSMKTAFPNKNVMPRYNFMKGGNTYLQNLMDYGVGIDTGIIVNDLFICTFHESCLYPMVRSTKGTVPRGGMVEYGGYTEKHPDGSRVTPMDLLLFGKNNLKLDYISWIPREPYFSNEVVPAVKKYPTLGN